MRPFVIIFDLCFSRCFNRRGSCTLNVPTFVVYGARVSWHTANSHVIVVADRECREKRHIRSIVGRAGRRMMVHHIGTAILGSILITVTSIPRAVIGFFNNL